MFFIYDIYILYPPPQKKEQINNVLSFCRTLLPVRKIFARQNKHSLYMKYMNNFSKNKQTFTEQINA